MILGLLIGIAFGLAFVLLALVSFQVQLYRIPGRMIGHVMERSSSAARAELLVRWCDRWCIDCGEEMCVCPAAPPRRAEIEDVIGAIEEYRTHPAQDDKTRAVLRSLQEYIRRGQHEGASLRVDPE